MLEDRVGGVYWWCGDREGGGPLGLQAVAAPRHVEQRWRVQPAVHRCAGHSLWAICSIPVLAAPREAPPARFTGKETEAQRGSQGKWDF